MYPWRRARWRSVRAWTGLSLRPAARAAIRRAPRHVLGIAYCTVSCAAAEAQDLLQYFQSTGWTSLRRPRATRGLRPARWPSPTSAWPFGSPGCHELGRYPRRLRSRSVAAWRAISATRCPILGWSGCRSGSTPCCRSAAVVIGPSADDRLACGPPRTLYASPLTLPSPQRGEGRSGLPAAGKSYRTRPGDGVAARSNPPTLWIVTIRPSLA